MKESRKQFLIDRAMERFMKYVTSLYPQFKWSISDQTEAVLEKVETLKKTRAIVFLVSSGFHKMALCATIEDLMYLKKFTEEYIAKAVEELVKLESQRDLHLRSIKDHCTFH